MQQPSPTRPQLQHGALFSHCPEGSLQRIASKANVHVTALSTLRIDDTTPLLYNAIAEYLALYHAHQPVAPLFVDSFEDVHHCQRLNDVHDSTVIDVCVPGPSQLETGEEDESDDEEIHKDFLMKLNPSFKFGFGSAEFSWPPPPYLKAERLNIALRKNRQRQKCSDGEDGDGEESEQSLWSEEEKGSVAHRLYILHYSLATLGSSLPQSGRAMRREMTLVSWTGQQPLRQFVSEVAKWREEKEYCTRGCRWLEGHPFAEYGLVWGKGGFNRDQIVLRVVCLLLLLLSSAVLIVDF